MKKTICLLPGDGIGPEIVAQGVAVLEAVAKKFGHEFDFVPALIGGAALLCVSLACSAVCAWSTVRLRTEVEGLRSLVNGLSLNSTVYYPQADTNDDFAESSESVAIDPNDPSNIPGTCIKCCACTTYCPSGAKKFDDPDFLSHTAMLEQYYTALGARDINGLFVVTDNLTAEEQAQIEAESDVESYGDVKAYTISGPSDGTYIAFVSSRCKYLGINQTLPMLSEYYLYTTEDGSLKIMDDTDSDAVVTEAMKAALENEEVKNLIEQVQNDYQNALDADASLRAYVESIQ